MSVTSACGSGASWQKACDFGLRFRRFVAEGTSVVPDTEQVAVVLCKASGLRALQQELGLSDVAAATEGGHLRGAGNAAIGIRSKRLVHGRRHILGKHGVGVSTMAIMAG